MKQFRFYLLFCLILMPEIYAIVSDTEDWPFTNAAMFSYYIDDKTPRYSFLFLGELVDPVEVKTLTYNEHKIYKSDGYEFHMRYLMKYFFFSVYGSSDPDSFHGQHKHDNSQKFMSRMEKFFFSYVEMIRVNTPELYPRLKVVRLMVGRQKGNELQLGLDSDEHFEESRLVGKYIVETKKFEHAWKN